MTRPSKPVDIYVRVSRVGGREHLMSPEDQERRAREHARQEGLTLGVVLPLDIDVSGGKWERPGLQEGLRRVRDGLSAGLIAADVDRFTRDAEHGGRLLRELEQAGARFYAPNAPDDMTTPEGEFQIGLWFLLAQLERKRKREGFERAKANAIAQGIPVATRPPIGYRQRDDRRLEPDPDSAPAIRELFDRRARGEGPTALGRFLESRGVRTSQGGCGWSKQAVASVLRSRVYLGELSYGKDRRYVNPAAHAPLVDLATWEAAQHPNGRRLQSPRGAGDYTLSGLLRCAACGYSMQATVSARGKRLYRCVRRHSAGECPQPARAYAEPVERVAERAFWSLTDDLEAVGHEDTTDLGELEVALERAERRLAQAETPEAQDAFGDRWFAVVRERREDRDHLAQQLGHARVEQARRAKSVPVDSLRDVWETGSAADRRELLAARFDVLALRRDSEGGLSLIAFPLGNGPEGLSRRGFRRNPGLRPIDVPPDARVLPLEDSSKRAGESVV
jgi:site-specific DNA recombinase